MDGPDKPLIVSRQVQLDWTLGPVREVAAFDEHGIRIVRVRRGYDRTDLALLDGGPDLWRRLRPAGRPLVLAWDEVDRVDARAQELPEPAIRFDLCGGGRRLRVAWPRPWAEAIRDELVRRLGPRLVATADRPWQTEAKRALIAVFGGSLGPFLAYSATRSLRDGAGVFGWLGDRLGFWPTGLALGAAGAVWAVAWIWALVRPGGPAPRPGGDLD